LNFKINLEKTVIGRFETHGGCAAFACRGKGMFTACGQAGLLYVCVWR